MAITEQTPRNVSTAAAGATVFPYSFKIANAADLEVQVNGATKTLNTDYTVSGVGVDAGGNVTFLSALVGGEVVSRRRAMAYARDTDYQNQGDLRASTINGDFDALVMMVQQLNERLAEVSDPPPSAAAYVGSNLTSTTAPVLTSPVATFAMETGKVYKVRAEGFCRALQAGAYGCSLRFYGDGTFAGTCVGDSRVFLENSATSNFSYLLKSDFLSGTAAIPALSHTTTGSRVRFVIELVVYCVTAGSLKFHFGSTSGSAQPVQLDAGALVTMQEVLLG